MLRRSCKATFRGLATADRREALDGPKAILEAHSLLKSGTPFSKSAHQVALLYEGTGTTFTEELLKYPRVTDSLFKFMYKNFQRSPNIRALVLQDICLVLLRHDCDAAANMIKLFTKSISIDEEVTPTPNSPATLANEVVLVASHAGDPFVAALLALQLRELGISDATVAAVARLLAVGSSEKFSYHAFTLLRLESVFPGAFNLLWEPIFEFLVTEQTPYFANVFYGKVKERLGASRGDVTKMLVRANLPTNFERALNLWKQLPFDVELTAKLLSCCKTSNLHEIISHIPSEQLDHPLLHDYALRHYGATRATQFDELLKRLEPPLRRSTLLVLFESFLTHNYGVAADRILQSILDTPNGVSSADFNVIITKLLNQNKLDTAIDMVLKTDVMVAKDAYVTVFSKLLHEKHPTAQHFYRKMTVEFRAFVTIKDPVLAKLTTTLLLYISHHVDNHWAREMYILSAYPENQRRTLDLLALHIPNEFNQLFDMSTNQIECLKIMAEKAVVASDTEMVAWTAFEMRVAGLPGDDIEAFFGAITKHPAEPDLHQP